MPKTPKKITAKFAGTCASCGDAIAVGAPIWWTPGKVTHVADVTPECKAKVLARFTAEAAADEAAAADKAKTAAAAVAAHDAKYPVGYNDDHGLCPDGCCGTFVPCGVAACCG